MGGMLKSRVLLGIGWLELLLLEVWGMDVDFEVR